MTAVDRAAAALEFSSVGRKAGDEDELSLTSVGIDIGSSTSHLLFSRIRLERRGSRYVTVERTVLRESNVILTPLVEGDATAIDGASLASFVDEEYERAGLARGEVDTGALVLTGLAVRRRNAREIGEVFAADAGDFVTVTAGDGLEATMAAHGSGAAAASRAGVPVLNVDIGGGTTKLALCKDGKVHEVAALDVGARLVVLDTAGEVARIEPAGVRFAELAGVVLEPGDVPTDDQIDRLTRTMADAVHDVIVSGDALPARTAALLRTPPLSTPIEPGPVIFSGGVSEFIHGAEARRFGDLGVPLGRAIERRLQEAGASSRGRTSGIRATAMGASQHTVQVSGSTIFVSPIETLPLRNVRVIAPPLDLSDQGMRGEEIADVVRRDVAKHDLALSPGPTAVAIRWQRTATFAHLEEFCAALVDGLGSVLSNGDALVVVSDGDIGGLLGMHLQETTRVTNPIVSIDGVELKEFDFIDVGSLVPASGAVPIVIKSLIFPAESDPNGTSDGSE